MSDNLYAAFQSYLNLVQSKIQNYREQPKVKKHLTLIKHAVVELEEIEKSDEFKKLKLATSELESPIFGDDCWVDEYSDPIKNWFRRSGVYLEMINNKRIEIEETFQKYQRAFQKQEIKTTYFLPLGLVHFNVESLDEVFNFGPFQIGFFSNPQFRELFQVEIRNIFYPDASIPVEDLDYIPFICIEESTISSNHDNFPTDKLNIEYTQYPEQVEFVLKMVALFNWEDIIEVDPRDTTEARIEIKQGKKRYWQGFEIPFILQVDNNLLRAPRRSPDFSKLRLVTYFERYFNQNITYPESAFTFDYHEIDKFKNFIRDIDQRLSILKLHSEAWNFVDSALGFFLKAFFTKGVEQLLWHIISMEALLSEKGESTTKALANKASLILGNAENTNVGKDIRGLYDFRSAIVHGRIHDSTVWVGELFKARTYSRKILIWFLNCLSLIAKGLPQDIEPAEIPSKDMILKFIDLDHNSRKLLSNVLPDKFPQI
ncbi:MAG: hypothetical protein ACQ9MH_14790 [Nitrospinales bacterium]